MNGDRVTARVAAQFRKDVSRPHRGILIRNASASRLRTNTRLEARRVGRVPCGRPLEVEFRFGVPAAQQEYTLTRRPSTSTGPAGLVDAISFQVVDPRGAAGVAASLPTSMPQGGRIVTATGATFFGHPRAGYLFFTEMWSASATTDARAPDPVHDGRVERGGLGFSVARRALFTASTRYGLPDEPAGRLDRDASSGSAARCSTAGF